MWTKVLKNVLILVILPANQSKKVPQNVWTVLCPQTPITPEKVQTEPEKFIKSLEPGNLSAPPSKKGLNMYRKKCFEKSVF